MAFCSCADDKRNIMVSRPNREMPKMISEAKSRTNNLLFELAKFFMWQILSISFTLALDYLLLFGYQKKRAKYKCNTIQTSLCEWFALGVCLFFFSLCVNNEATQLCVFFFCRANENVTSLSFPMNFISATTNILCFFLLFIFSLVSIILKHCDDQLINICRSKWLLRRY